ncbi:MAG TPA: response regulator transcription factor [Anaerolineales bacterium]|nr:response regulator transcription factor [Anaerolineales bacterium]
MQTILIIEDEPELVKVLRSYLEQAGYFVMTAYRGDSGLSTWEHKLPDLVILDLNLPGMDGLDVAREIRRKSDTPILMLTARVEESDELVGLELGVDEHITKPFSPHLVLARVRAMLRRATTPSADPKVLHVVDLELDLEAYSLTRDNVSIDQPPTEFNLLSVMAAQPGRAFTLTAANHPDGGVVFTLLLPTGEA